MRVDPRRELAALKDFQRATARYAFRRMYRDSQPAHRFLVADEVGLGKTLVARAVIAQVIAHLHDLGEQRIDVVYVCSNATIAEQNLRKLAPAGVPPPERTGRLSLLPGWPRPRQDGVGLIALTPGTSLDHGYAPAGYGSGPWRCSICTGSGEPTRSKTSVCTVRSPATSAAPRAGFRICVNGSHMNSANCGRNTAPWDCSVKRCERSTSSTRHDRDGR